MNELITVVMRVAILCEKESFLIVGEKKCEVEMREDFYQLTKLSVVEHLSIYLDRQNFGSI